MSEGHVLKVEIKYNPYLVETDIWINNERENKESNLLKKIEGKRLQDWKQEWILKFLITLSNGNDKVYLTFLGTDEDYQVFREKVIKYQKIAKCMFRIQHRRCAYYSDFVNDIANTFARVRKKLLIDDPLDKGLIEAYEKIANPYFRINVVATMSAGKSTLINALLGKRLLPSKNEACTASIIEILDTDQKNYKVTVYDRKQKIIEGYQNTLDKVRDISANDLAKLNDDPQVGRIHIEGDIPFIDSKGTALMLVDTPGPNNSQDISHRDITFQEVCENDRNIILYVLNGTQLSTNDDAELLDHIADQMKTGKASRDRILFVINKMDQFDPEDENIEAGVENAKKYLKGHGIINPRLFVCSALAALEIRTALRDIDFSCLTLKEERKLPMSTRSALCAINKLNDYSNMYLEQYAVTSETIRREVGKELEAAIKEGDERQQALIHSGVYTLERYISTYVKTETVKDLMHFLNETMKKSVI